MLNKEIMHLGFFEFWGVWKKWNCIFEKFISIHNFNDILKYRPWIAYYLLKFFAVKVATVVVNISKELNLVLNVSASVKTVINKTELHETTATSHNQYFFLNLICISLIGLKFKDLKFYFLLFF